ncbi:hypothetical protein NSK_005529 [Nannochloropsis salina CCMP1776]|uniref:Uncharacterized protein n=1 Tax=Nannochloropsis salina CCMP1776 TaxID=1027361 RepID=A0A4D9CVD8_9STRA|nr:hypothetical protein NSK_005529 [Nannochloropsis salina CCMP1776]|eukprot:TFJ83170.1 hypothetical protein NSK_005529 [Nannochloropsis salina CCMP1776]
MPSLSFKLGLIILAALALQTEAQTTRVLDVQSPQGFSDKHGLHSRLEEFLISREKRCGKSCGIRRGSSPHSDFAKAEKLLEYSATASQQTALNGRRKDRFLERDLLRKPRKRRWISKRKLKKQLQECEARLQETQAALDAPRNLFVQMAQHCTLERAAGRYYLRTTDMDADTYVFTEMPLQQANVWPTSYFVGYLFDEFFADEKPNAAFTFNVYNNQSEKTFEGPLISVLLSSHQFVLQEDNSTLVVYELAQSSEQEATSPLSRFFRGTDPLGNASVTYEHCSLFIDPVSGVDGDSFYSAAESRDDTVDALNRAAQSVEKGPDQTTPEMQTYTRVWSFEQPKPLAPKDVYKGAADSMKVLATLIQECNGKGCGTKDIVEGLSNILMPVAYAIGAAFPAADAVITIVASLGLLFSSLFFDPASPQAGAISPSQIEDAVKKGLARYDATKDKDLINQYSVFLKVDLDNFVRRTGSLAYIRNQKKDDFQAQIDQQVEHWKTDEFTGAWNEYQGALVPIQADYDRWFGTLDDENNLRVDVVNWINDNANKCRVVNRPEGMPEGTDYDQYPPPVYDSKKVDDFQKCRKNVGEGPDKWDRLMEFSEAYLHMATILMMFSSQATVIMQMTSFCDPANDIIYQKGSSLFAATSKPST